MEYHQVRFKNETLQLIEPENNLEFGWMDYKNEKKLMIVLVDPKN